MIFFANFWRGCISPALAVDAYGICTCCVSTPLNGVDHSEVRRKTSIYLFFSALCWVWLLIQGQLPFNNQILHKVFFFKCLNYSFFSLTFTECSLFLKHCLVYMPFILWYRFWTFFRLFQLIIVLICNVLKSGTVHYN